MSDIVERLRSRASYLQSMPRPSGDYTHGALMGEAADEIERLRQFAPRVVNINKEDLKKATGDLSFSPPSADFGVKSG